MGILVERFRQKYRTMSYPDGPPPPLPDRWRGQPVLTDEWESGLTPETTNRCPAGAISLDGGASLDLGRCLLCGACGVEFGRDYATGRFRREDLVLRTNAGPQPELEPARKERLAQIRSLFGKSLKLRQVSAGGCNACEADSNVLGTLAWDMGRFGMAFVASPRHADGVLVTGPVTDNMKLALEKTYAAVPSPKVVIAVGACAVSGGVYGDGGGRGVLDGVLPVDLYIPGCPPHPLSILEGLLRLVGRIPDLSGMDLSKDRV